MKISTADGVDVFNYPKGHDHFNWAFLEAGVYELEFTITGTHVTDGVKSATGSFTFAVGDAASVPEASSLLLCSCAGAVAVRFQRGGWQRVAKRRRERSACTAKE